MTVAENQVPRAPIRQMLMSIKAKNGFVFSGSKNISIIILNSLYREP
jgi:hypothetical protein